MTELQLGLIGLGVVAVCGVVIYNKWQERKHRALAERVLGSPAQDALFDQTEAISPQQRERDLPFDDRREGLSPDSASAWRADEVSGLATQADEPAAPPIKPAAEDPPVGMAAKLAGRFGFARKKTAAGELGTEPDVVRDGEPRIEPALPLASLSVEERREPIIDSRPSTLQQSIGADPSPGETGERAIVALDTGEAEVEPLPNFLHRASVDAMAAPQPTQSASVPPAFEPNTVSFDEPGTNLDSASSVGASDAEATIQAPAEERADVRREVGGYMPLSPLIDYVATFEAVDPVGADKIIQLPAEALAHVRKGILRMGFNEHAHEWEMIEDASVGDYRRFRIGLQLVDRQGPVSESELSVFQVAMQDLADATMSIIDLPPRPEALSTAAELDAFCAGVDIQIGINVVSQAQTFPGTKLRALAEAAGMVMDIEGRFVRRDDEGNVLYVMLNHEAQPFAPETMRTLSTHGLTFLLDVPCVPHGERVFNQMVDLAKRFSDVLRGVVVDDNRRPLSESSLEPIRKQVAHYQAILATQRLPAGSALTRRLFS